MKYSFSKVVLKDLEGKKVEDDLSKKIANLLYFGDHQDLDLVKKAEAMHAGEAVELDKTELEVIKGLYSKAFAPFARKAVNDYIESVKA